MLDKQKSGFKNERVFNRRKVTVVGTRREDTKAELGAQEGQAAYAVETANAATASKALGSSKRERY